MIIGINASRARSGGAKSHLIGILSEGNPVAHGVTEVHVWSYSELLEVLPDQPWLVKHCPPETEQSMLRQIWWERFELPKALKANCCDVLLNVDAGTVCRFRPAVTMSRDMLAFEPGEAKRLGFSKSRFRQIALRYIQGKSLTLADGAIFLTRYASKVIQRSSGQVKREVIIPHGIGEIFKKTDLQISWSSDRESPIHCLYVSPVWIFKHQWVVVRAIQALRRRGYDLTLTLVGGGDEAGLKLLGEQIRLSDPDGTFVNLVGAIPQNELPSYIANSDLFVFASSCENMPNSLLEAMAVGLPIACSNRGPMPEVLEDGGIYFDPENYESIADAIQTLLENNAFRQAVAHKAKALSQKYSWASTADKTFNFIREIYRDQAKKS